MPEVLNTHTHSENEMEIEAQEELRKAFQNMPNEIPIILFTDSLKNDIFNRAVREVIRYLREMTSKITLREFDLSHKESSQREIKYAPTILFDPEKSVV